MNRQLQDIPPKFCKDCKHIRTLDTPPTCANRRSVVYDLVQGTKKVMYTSCAVNRDLFCGREGSDFEPREE